MSCKIYAGTRMDGLHDVLLPIKIKKSAVSVCVLCSVAPCRILASCTELMQAIKELVLSSKHLQRDIVESGRVSYAAVFPLRLFPKVNIEEEMFSIFSPIQIKSITI